MFSKYFGSSEYFVFTRATKKKSISKELDNQPISIISFGLLIGPRFSDLSSAGRKYLIGPNEIDVSSSSSDWSDSSFLLTSKVRREKIQELLVALGSIKTSIWREDYTLPISVFPRSFQEGKVSRSSSVDSRISFLLIFIIIRLISNRDECNLNVI